jgi:hypothetical protein
MEPDKSDNKQLTRREVVSHRNDIIEYLIDQEISDFGRRSFDDMAKYIKSHVHYDWPSDRTKELADIYFVRNVIAHYSGFIRDSQQSRVPPGISVVEKQLRIEREYLQQCSSTVRSAVDEFHGYVQKRWCAEPAITLDVPPAD